MPDPMVSVIIPTRNRANLLGHAIDSVLKQDYEDFELLIIDADSKDQTAELVASFKDPRVRYCRTGHQGISHSLNTGITQARGDYIARLDSDDEWLPGLLKEMIAVLSENNDIGVAYAKAQAMDAKGQPLEEYRGIPLWWPDDSFKSMLYGDVTCNIALVARRECFDVAGTFDTDLAVHEDWDFWLRVSRHFRFFFVDQVLARYRYHEGNITGAKSQEYESNIEKRLDVLNKVFAQDDLPPGALEIRQQAYANAHIWVGSDWWNAGNVKRALAHFRNAWKVRGYAVGAFFRTVWGVVARNVMWKYRWGQKLTLKLNRLMRKEH